MNMKFLVFAFAILFLISACSTAPTPTTRTPTPTSTAGFDLVFMGLTDRCKGMTYISETNSDLTTLKFADPKVITDEDTFGAALAVDPAHVVQRSVSQFFQHQIRIHPNVGWEDLNKYMNANLTGLKMFRVAPNPRTPTYYILGVHGDHVDAITFQAVET